MNTDEQIKELYAGVFDDIHASDELKRKVRNMTEGKRTRNIRAAVKVAYAAAAAAVILAAGNVIAYAATGEALFKVFVNGVEQEVSASSENGAYSFSYSTDDMTYDVVLEGDFESDIEAVYIDDTEGGVSVSGDLGESGSLSFVLMDDVRPELLREDDKTYISVGDEKIDITEDYKDGTAEGTFEMDGAVFSYTVDSDESISLLIEE